MSNEIYENYYGLLNLELGMQKRIGYAFYKDYGYIKTLNPNAFQTSLKWFNSHIERLVSFTCDDVNDSTVGYFSLFEPIFELIEDDNYIELHNYELMIQKWLYDINVALCYPSDPFAFITSYDLQNDICYSISNDNNSDITEKFLVNDYSFTAFINDKFSDVKIYLEHDLDTPLKVKVFKVHYMEFMNDLILKFVSIEFFKDVNLFEKKRYIRNLTRKNHPMLQSTIAMRLELEEDEVRKIALDAFILFVCIYTAENDELRQEILDCLDVYLARLI
jgi:hypothetical protein